MISFTALISKNLIMSIIKRSMSMRILILTLLAVFAVPAFGQQSGDILGTWLNEDKDGKVTIYEDNGVYFGKITWLEDATNDDGSPRTDEKNPNKDLKSQPLDGLVILKNFKYDGESEWKGGKIYDPKKGKTYSCYMKFESSNKLKIRGFVAGMRSIGRTTYWTRTS